MVDSRLARTALLLAGWLATAAQAAAQPPAARTIALETPLAAEAARPLVVVNPHAWAAQLTVTVRPAAGFEARPRAFSLPPTSQRTIRIGTDLPVPGGAPSVVADLACVNADTEKPCPRGDDVIAAQPVLPGRPASAAGLPPSIGPLPWHVLGWLAPQFSTPANAGTAIAAGPWTRPATESVLSLPAPDDAAPSIDRYFAEGFTGITPSELRFATDFVIRNPDGARAAEVELLHCLTNGWRVKQRVTVAPGAQVLVHANETPGMSDVSFGTRVRSTNAVPVSTWRVMQWGHQPESQGEWSATRWTGRLVGGGVAKPRATWVFPGSAFTEGTDTFFAVFNPSTRALMLRVTFMLEDGSGTTLWLRVAPTSRYTFSPVLARTMLWNRRFAAFVESIPEDSRGGPVPFVAERSDYSGAFEWTNGTVAAGVPWTGEVTAPPIVPPPPPTRASMWRLTMAPFANAVAWLLAAWGVWRTGTRPATARRAEAQPGARPSPRLRTALVVSAALVGLFWPTSIAGEMSRTLNAAAVIATVALLGGLFVLPEGAARGLPLANSIALVALLSVATLFTPLRAYAPGTIFIYLGLAVLLALDLRAVRFGRAIDATFVGVNAAFVALGVGMLAGAPPVVGLLSDWYRSFRPDLILEMVATRKPVATFGTHSLAAFMSYLMAFGALLRCERSADRRWLGLALLHALLMVGLQSTSANILLCVLLPHLIWVAWRRFPRRMRPLVAAAAVAFIASAVWVESRAPSAPAGLAGSLVGDRAHGLFVRYAPGGLMEGNFAFLRRNPMTPVGFGMSDRLYFGDSGVVVALLRGGLPAVTSIYGGLFLLFRRSVSNHRVALWLWAVTTLFEVGFTPLQLYRYVGFLPLYLVWIDAAASPAAPSDPLSPSERRT